MMQVRAPMPALWLSFMLSLLGVLSVQRCLREGNEWKRRLANPPAGGRGLVFGVALSLSLFCNLWNEIPTQLYSKLTRQLPLLPGFDFYFPEPWGANHSGFVVKLIPFVWCIIVVSAKQITTVHEYIHPRVSTMKAIFIFYPFFLLSFSLTPFLHGCVKWGRHAASLKSFFYGKFSRRTLLEDWDFTYSTLNINSPPPVAKPFVIRPIHSGRISLLLTVTCESISTNSAPLAFSAFWYVLT